MKEEITVTLDDYKYVLTEFYGHWICFVVLFILVIGKYYTNTQYAYLIAEWANSDQQEQAPQYR